LIRIRGFILPGVPGRFLFFLVSGGGGLGLGFVFCSLGSPGRVVESEKGSLGIICILVKGE